MDLCVLLVRERNKPPHHEGRDGLERAYVTARTLPSG